MVNHITILIRNNIKPITKAMIRNRIFFSCIITLVSPLLHAETSITIASGATAIYQTNISNLKQTLKAEGYRSDTDFLFGATGQFSVKYNRFALHLLSTMSTYYGTSNDLKSTSEYYALTFSYDIYIIKHRSSSFALFPIIGIGDIDYTIKTDQNKTSDNSIIASAGTGIEYLWKFNNTLSVYTGINSLYSYAISESHSENFPHIDNKATYSLSQISFQFMIGVRSYL